MGKSTKKSASKVAAVAAPASSPAKDLKKGKREAEVVIEKELVCAKKQKASGKKNEIEPEKKKDKKRVESEQKPKAKAPPLTGKPDSESHSVSSGVAEDAPTPVPAKNVAAPPPSNGRSEEELVVPAKKAKAEEETEEDLKKKTKASPEPAPKEQSIVGGDGSKTLFVKNMSFQVKKADVLEFFKPAGQVVDVRLAKSREDDSFKGFGHVEFATAEQAEKALLELDGKELLHRPVKLEVAREEKKGEQKQSFKRRPKLEVFVKGFDAFAGEDNIRASMMAHFASCGEIARVSIPLGEDGNSRGIAYVQFLNENARSKALELGNETLVVEEPRPRADSNIGGFGSGRGRRGRGFNNRPSKVTPGANTIKVGGD